MEKKLVENIVYSTTDYNLFKTIAGNRPESRQHTKYLMDSYSKTPDLIKTRPILVNEKLEIIDGQHRYQACINLGLPIYYTVAKNTDINTARFLNANQKAWRLEDYLNSYVTDGKEQYIKLKQLREEYPIPLSLLIWFASGHSAHNLLRSFRSGNFKFMKDKELMYKRLDNLRDLANKVPHWNHNRFVSAYWTVVNNPEFDNKRLLDKLKQTKFEPQVTSRDYLREIERVYNYSSKVPIRLF